VHYPLCYGEDASAAVKHDGPSRASPAVRRAGAAWQPGIVNNRNYSRGYARNWKFRDWPATSAEFAIS
jgi:hypothetical protein